jgi:uncharacterized protein YggE
MLKPFISSLFILSSIYAAPIANAHSAGSSHDAQATQKRLIPVSAAASLKMAPDQASVEAGVVTEGKDASETATENAAKMTAIYAALNQAGIVSADIKTSQLSLSPRYDYESRKKPRIVGYTANNIITVETRDLMKVTPIIDALVRSGSNNIRNVQFSLSDPEAAKAKVLEEAIKKARAKAQLIARSAGVTLGPLQDIRVNDSYSPNGQNYDEIIVTGARKGGGGGSGVVSTPISQGELTVSASVNLTYEMR